jgi:cyclopropane-fatty-acyl-phospholipid synthase
MSTLQLHSRDSTTRRSWHLLHDLLADYPHRDFAVRLWDGSTWEAEPGQPTRCTIVLRRPGSLRKLLTSRNDVGLAEAYIYGDLDIEGDLFAVFPLTRFIRNQHRDWPHRALFAARALLLPSDDSAHAGRQHAELHGTPHTPQRDRQAVRYHYDVSNDFYKLWLDRRMVYSCAYFADPADDLDSAQERKLDYICRKLRLQPGERFLDIGCGWGGLILHAAKHYGVRAVGITLSRRQAELARERIAEEKLTDRCEVRERDYRELTDAEGFDRLASVGMFEHVGEARLPTYFRQAWRLLRPGGAFLNHGIALAGGERMTPGPTFLKRYVFPDGELVPLNVTVRAAEEAGFEARDVESLREHYAKTLRCWIERLKARAAEARAITDDVTCRVWRLYMAGSADGFDTGEFNLYQTLLCKPDHGRSGFPATRADWYA